MALGPVAGRTGQPAAAPAPRRRRADGDRARRGAGPLPARSRSGRALALRRADRARRIAPRRALQRLHAVLLSPEQAQLLDVPPASPALYIERRSFLESGDAGRVHRLLLSRRRLRLRRRALDRRATSDEPTGADGNRDDADAPRDGGGAGGGGAADRRQCRGSAASSAQRLRAQPPRFVVTCARGSSDSAATYAKYLIEIRLRRRGRLGRPVGQLDLWRAAADAMARCSSPISQSGRSPDLLDARRGGARRRRADRGAGQRHGLAAGRALRGRAAAPCRAGEERRRDQVLHRLAGGPAAAPRRLERRPGARPRRRAAARRPCDALRRDWRAAVAPLAAARKPLCRRARRRLRRRAGSGAEAQGDLRPPCRGDERRRAHAWTAGARRAGLPA